MPQLLIKGATLEEIKSISKAMTDEMVDVLKCPRDYIVLEYVPATYVCDGEVTAGYPLVNVLWFDRGQDIQNKVAEIVTRYLKGFGYGTVDVFFNVLEPSRYYENGSPF